MSVVRAGVCQTPWEVPEVPLVASSLAASVLRALRTMVAKWLQPQPQTAVPRVSPSPRREASFRSDDVQIVTPEGRSLTFPLQLKITVSAVQLRPWPFVTAITRTPIG